MRILHIFGAILVLIATPVSAQGVSVWIVAQKSGDVRVLRSGMQPASVQLRSALAPGDLVATGVNGRAMLTNGDDYVIVAPGSRLIVPKEQAQQQAGFTRLVQQLGTMLYKVKHTGIPHFSVQTPMLAAVVKGTSFTIVVDQDRAAVQVTDGVVEVSSAAGNTRRLVERGITVYVGRERPNEIVEMRPGAADMPSSTSSDNSSVKITGTGDMPLSAVTALTGGLVREAPDVQAPTVVSTPVVNAVTAQPSAAVTVSSTTPVVAVADSGTPAASTPAVTVSTAAAPVATVSSVTVQAGTVTTPVVTVSPVTVQAVTVPSVTTPVATVSSVTIPAVSVPAVTIPAVTVSPTTIATPTVTIPAVTTPAITTPTITTPLVTVPSVTIPAVTVPTVTVPVISIGLPLGP
jgi:hypothetical protein